jgi:hypothetical protein
MDRKNNDDSSERVIVLILSVMIVFYLFIAGIITGWTMPTRNEEPNNSQRSISSMYSSFVGQPEKEVKE